MSTSSNPTTITKLFSSGRRPPKPESSSSTNNRNYGSSSISCSINENSSSNAAHHDNIYNTSTTTNSNEGDHSTSTKEEEVRFAAEAKLWKSYNDPNKGRIYWYNTQTKETQWRKPLCVISNPEERQHVAEKERLQRDFFAVMEANILCSMSGIVPPSPNDQPLNTSNHETTANSSGVDEERATVSSRSASFTRTISGSKYQLSKKLEGGSESSNTSAAGIGSSLYATVKSSSSSLIRTISGMDDSVLKTLVNRVPSHRSILKKPNKEWRIASSPQDKSDVMNHNSRVRFGGVHFEPIQQQNRGSTEIATSDAVLKRQRGSLNVKQFDMGDDSESNHELTSDTTTPNYFSREDSMQFCALDPGSTSRSTIMANANNFNNSISLSSLQQQQHPSFSLNSNSTTTTSGGSISLTKSVTPIHYSSRNNDTSNSDNMSMSLSGVDGNGSFTFKCFDESKIDFDMSTTELLAFTKLSEIADEMTNVAEDDTEFSDLFLRSSIDGDNSSNRNLDDEDDDVIIHDDDDDDDDDDDSTKPPITNLLDGLQVLDEIDDESRSSTSGDDNKNNDNGDAVEKSTEAESVFIESTKRRDMPGLSPVQRQPGFRKKLILSPNRSPERSPRRGSVRVMRSMREVGRLSERLSPALLASSKPGGGLQRRNTCGAIHVGSNALSAPDKDATIRCVCGVYRAHIIQSERIQYEMSVARDDDDNNNVNEGMNDEYATKYQIFNDVEPPRQQQPLQSTNTDGKKGSDSIVENKLQSRDRLLQTSRIQPRISTAAVATATLGVIPTLDEITTFYRDVFDRAEMESDCIVISLIYAERLIQQTDGVVRPCIVNWRSILFGCMVLASKVWDESAIGNDDFSHTCTTGVSFPLHRVNELERAILSALEYQVKVLASEYAKYYFLLRSMLIKSGLGSEDVTSMSLLDVEGARRLQHLSAQYEKQAMSMLEFKKQDAFARGTSLPTINDIGS